MPLANPFQVMEAFSISHLGQLVLTQGHTTGFSVKLHPAESTGNGQQPVVQRFIPNEGEIQLLESHIEGRPMTLHFCVGQGAIHIPKDR